MAQDSTTERKRDKRSADALIQQATERLKKCKEAEHELRELSREDFRFFKGDQWPADIKELRKKQGSLAVCMTVNLCKPAVKQITNDQRQNRGAIKVSPVDSGADPETAKVLQGVIRHIEYDSDADIAYDTASEHQVIGGFGYLRVITEYEEPRSFYQCIKIRRFRTPFAVYLDPSHQAPDGSDAKYAFVLTKLTKEEYEDEYGDSEMVGFLESDEANQFPNWLSDDGVVVAEYYYTESEKDTLYQLTNGSVALKSELGEEPLEESIFQQRDVERERIKWCKLNAVEILEETDWPGKYIPIVKVSGDELEIDGELWLEGIVRQAKEPQRMVNYYESKKTEAIALAPKAPYVAAAGQIENYKSEWDRANIDNLAVQRYDPIDVAGTLVPEPKRNVVEPAIAAITVGGQSARDNLKDVTQLFEASYGKTSNEKSGKAILARQQQGQAGNFHFVDNLTRSRRHLGRILIDLIPKIYHEPGRILRIIGEDGTQDSVKIGKRQEGMKGIYEPGVGRYDVIVETGPSFATKRKEAVDSMLSIVGSPAGAPLMQVMADLLIKNMDWPGSDDMSERAKFLLPPEIRQQEEGQQPLPPQVQAQMAQQGQLIDLLTKELNAKNDLIEKNQLEIDSRERIEQAKIASHEKIELSKRMEAQWKLDSQEAIAALKADVEAMKANIQVDMAAQAREAEAAAETM